jgi:hypothetical protein
MHLIAGDRGRTYKGGGINEASHFKPLAAGHLDYNNKKVAWMLTPNW